MDEVQEVPRISLIKANGWWHPNQLGATEASQRSASTQLPGAAGAG